REIVEGYARRHPDVIRPLWADRNIGIVGNFARCWAACRGEYIAVLEGDDYWTGADKLQRQVDVLERHPGWAMCFQRVRVVSDDGRPPGEFPTGPQKPVFTLRDLLAGNPVQTCGVVYRAGLVPALPAAFLGLALGDWPLAILHALRGDVGFLDEVMAVYRRHAAGAWSTRPVAWRNAQVDRMFDVIRPLVTRAVGSAEPMWGHDARWAGDYMAAGTG